MNILITGAGGFIGRNLIEALRERKVGEPLQFERESDPRLLEHYAGKCDLVYHLAAVHRPPDVREFEQVNHLFFASMLELLRSKNNTAPVVLTSTIQAGEDTPYGKSKLAAEQALLRHAALNDSRATIYRLTNTFGRYARPHSHSVVATFCYNLARGLPLEIHEPGRVMRFYYIDDVVDSLLTHLDDCPAPDRDGFHRLPEQFIYEVTLHELAERIRSIMESLESGRAAGGDLFTQRLCETYLSYC